MQERNSTFRIPRATQCLPLKTANNKLILQRFDLTNLREVKRSEKISLPNLTYLYNVVRIYGRVYLLLADYSDGRQNLKLFAQQVDPLACALVGKLVPVLEGKNINIISVQQRGIDGSLMLLGFRADRMGGNTGRRLCLLYGIGSRPYKDWNT